MQNLYYSTYFQMCSVIVMPPVVISMCWRPGRWRDEATNIQLVGNTGTWKITAGSQENINKNIERKPMKCKKVPHMVYNARLVMMYSLIKVYLCAPHHHDAKMVMTGVMHVGSVLSKRSQL